MFELENNRGKDLTNLEKLKSFLMYQLYVYSDPNETDDHIQFVAGLFDPIYRIVNSMSDRLSDEEDGISGTISEDNILLYHSYAYSQKFFNYRNLNDIIEEFKSVPQANKVTWIRNYTHNLYTTFSNIQRILSIDDPNLKKLKKWGSHFLSIPS